VGLSEKSRSAARGLESGAAMAKSLASQAAQATDAGEMSGPLLGVIGAAAALRDAAAELYVEVTDCGGEG
jgi:hypothetical protein